MAELIECRECTSPYCQGCNLYILSRALRDGKFDSLMNENRLVVVPKNVTPVRQGRNIHDTVPEHCEFKCSLCGAELSSVYGGRNDFGMDGGYLKYCPNCGCRMDLEVDNE